MAVRSRRIISLAAAAAATAVGVRHEHVRGDFKIQRSRAWKEGQSMRTSTYIGDGRRRHVTHLCGCGRLGRSESRGRGSTCTSVEAHMLRCSANLPASFIVAAVADAMGSSFKFSCEIFLQLLQRKQKKLGMLTHLSRVSFGWQTLRSASFFFLHFKEKSPPPSSLPLVTSDHCSFRQHPTSCTGTWHSTDGGLLAKTLHFYAY